MKHTTLAELDVARHRGTKEITMQGTVLYRPRDVRVGERDVPRIIKPTDATIRLSATCICGSDLA